MKKLAQIQKELKAPKTQTNSFGNYKYRNCEDIVEALKPLMDEDDKFTLSDEIWMVGDRFYVKATATFNDTIVTAFARESAEKKGMDAAQITGSTSSYARKYALNGLFAIDDTKDADTTNTGDKQTAGPGGSLYAPIKTAKVAYSPKINNVQEDIEL